MRRIRYLLEAAGLVFLLGIIRLLPVDAASNLGGFLGRTLGPRLPVTNRARRNLRLAFPDKPEPEIERIARAMWDNLGRVAAEYPHLGRIAALESGRIDWIDSEPVRAMRDGTTTGILVSGHLANWEVTPISATWHGLDITIIVREPNNPFVRTLIGRLRGVAGGGRAPKGAAGARKAIEVLRTGRVLGLLFDQKMSDGISAPFFGVEAMTSAAPAQLALKFRCPLVPVRIERTGPARFRLSSYAALDLPDSGDRQADVANVMGELNRILEGWIRGKPEEWLWLHRRWPEAAYRQSEARAKRA